MITSLVRHDQTVNNLGVASDTIIVNGFDTVNSVEKGEKVPNYRYLISVGGNATTNLSGTRYTLTRSPSYLAASRTRSGTLTYTSKYSISGDIFPIAPPSVLDTSFQSALNQAKSRFVSACRDTQGAFKTGIFLGELRSTAKLIGSSAKRLQSGLNSYLDRGFSVKSRTRRIDRLKVMADLWLEYSFGWKPLINDVEDAVRELARNAHRPPSVMITAKGKHSSPGSTYTLHGGGLGLLSYTYGVRTTETAEAKIYGKLNLEVNDTLKTGVERFSVGLQDFVPTVWELIPYSFLVDYFANVGDILSAMSFNRAALNWTSYGTKRTTTRVVTDKRMFVATQSAPFSLKSRSTKFGLYKWELVSVNRYRELASLVPSIEFSFPTSATKIANLASLLVSKHKRLVPFL